MQVHPSLSCRDIWAGPETQTQGHRSEKEGWEGGPHHQCSVPKATHYYRVIITAIITAKGYLLLAFQHCRKDACVHPGRPDDKEAPPHGIGEKSSRTSSGHSQSSTQQKPHSRAREPHTLPPGGHSTRLSRGGRVLLFTYENVYEGGHFPVTQKTLRESFLCTCVCVCVWGCVCGQIHTHRYTHKYTYLHM